MVEEEIPNYKLQPVILHIEKRLECQTCHALAVIVSMSVSGKDRDGDDIFDYKAYCQDCWHNFINEDED